MRIPSIRPVKSLVILDKDNCEIDTLKVFGVLDQTLKSLSADLDLPLELLHDLTREAEGEHRFNDAIGLINYMHQIEPRFKTDRPGQAAIVHDIQRSWLKATTNLSAFYPGVLETLKAWHQAGTNVVTKTDAERLPLIRRVWLTAYNACHVTGELSSPYEALALYDHLYCKPSIGEPDDRDARAFNAYLAEFCSTYEVPYAFAHKLNSRITAFRDGHKPSPAHLRHIFTDFPVPHEQALYIGDNHKDGLEAHSVDPKIDFAWARYGTSWGDDVREFYAKVGSSNYKYGEEHIKGQLDLHGIRPAATLGTSFADIRNYFDFTSNPGLSRHSMADMRAVAGNPVRTLFPPKRQ